MASSRRRFLTTFGAAAAGGAASLGGRAFAETHPSPPATQAPDMFSPTELLERRAKETVAAGTGVVVLPMSVARQHHRKDVTFRPVTDLPTTTVGLVWRTDHDDDRVQAFIGVVRGRTANSSRR